MPQICHAHMTPTARHSTSASTYTRQKRIAGTWCGQNSCTRTKWGNVQRNSYSRKSLTTENPSASHILSYPRTTKQNVARIRYILEHIFIHESTRITLNELTWTTRSGVHCWCPHIGLSLSAVNEFRFFLVLKLRKKETKSCERTAVNEQVICQLDSKSTSFLIW